MRRFAVIMAGGAGERFWPVSRRLRPKQLLRLTDPERSMIAEAIDRIAPLIPRENVLVATSEALGGAIAAAVPDLPRDNLIAEPAKRNTAACLALAAAHVAERRGPIDDVSIAVLTADHRIGEPERFRATVDAALSFAEGNDVLVTIGVMPTRPETGYGYIEVAADAEAAGATGERGEGSEWAPEHPVPTSPAFGIDPDDLRVLPVARFREKPDAATAAEWARSGRHYWNSGMFFWRATSFLEGLARHMPELARATDGMRAALRAGDARPSDLRAIFEALADVPIDVGLMERATNVHVVPATFPWDDVGAWDALARSRPADRDGNVVEGDAVLLGARDCVVYNDGGEEMAVAAIGVEGLIVVTTPDGVLVCSKERAQDVRRAVAEIRARGRDRLT
ncbi:MAG TPA: sugar phosphate nucleotidyltransferase [Candidatus Binatia bacterium]|nr:sugar phosphate nucleotidyltransferase [Candidatus Binatia bacterium]